MQEANIETDTLGNLDSFVNLIYKLFNVRFATNSFAILSYAKDRGMIAIRFVGKEYVGFGYERHLQLGFLVKPTAYFEKKFEMRSYFFLGEYSNRLTIN
jgi:hypothetical protein